MIFATACDKFDILGIFAGQSPKANARFAQSLEYNSINPFITLQSCSNDYNVYVIADIHVSTGTSCLKQAVTSITGDTDAEKFTLCLGDMTSKKGCLDIACEELMPLNRDGRMLFSTPGNHDLYFGEWECYRKWFPSSSYAFFVQTPSAGTDVFLCVDSSEGTLGTDQRKWLEEMLVSIVAMTPRNVVVFTHTNFFRINESQGITGNFTTDETYDLLSLFSKYGVDMVLTGHDHYYERTDFRGVKYLTLNAFVENEKKHSYYRFSFGEEIKFSESFIE